MATVIGSRDILWTSPYTDADVSSYSEVPSSKELELRVAATPAGSGALIVRRQSVSQIVAAERTGRQLDGLQTTTGTTPSAGVVASTYSATEPTGYSGNNLQMANTAVNPGTLRKACSVGAQDLSVFGGGTLIRIQRRFTSVTNLNIFSLRFEFATTGDFAQFTIGAAADAINTWAEVVVAKGSPTSTGGTVDWSQWSGNILLVCAATGGTYSGNLTTRDLRIGTVQTAKDTPDGGFAWETSIDSRARYRDDATAKASTTLAANSAAAATNVKVASVANLAVGDDLTIITAGFVETRTITVVGTSGSGGSGVTVSQAFTYAHTSADVAEVRYWGSWTPWLPVKASQPPTVAASSPADNALVTDPTPPLVHTFSSPGGKLQASRTYHVYQRIGYANRELAGAPAAYWRVGETAGTTAVDAIAAHNGTYTGGYTLNQTGALSPADPDPAVLLNGTTGYITVPTNTALHPGDTFTLSAWVKKAADGTAQTIIAAGTGDYCLRINAANQLELLKEGTGTAVLTSAVTITGTAWHRVTCTKAGATTTLAIDGVVDTGATGTNATIVASTVAVAIGRKASTSSEFFNGTLDEVTIWSRALPAAESSALYQARLEVPGDQLIRSQSVLGAGLTDTLPAYLLANAAAYAWDKTAYDTDGLGTTTVRRAFTSAFSVPSAITNAVATPDPENGSIVLTWDASSDPNLDHYRVYWRNAAGAYIRIDGGPAALDDGLTPLTVATFTHYGARLGLNEYQVTVHTGAAESDPTSASGTLLSVIPGTGMVVGEEDGSRYTFPVNIVDAPRTHPTIAESMSPPGRGSTVHYKWGNAGKQYSLRVWTMPSEDGDVSTLLDELLDAFNPVWFKLPAAYLFEPLWGTVIGLVDTPMVDAVLTLAVDVEETERS